MPQFQTRPRPIEATQNDDGTWSVTLDGDTVTLTAEEFEEFVVILPEADAPVVPAEMSQDAPTAKSSPEALAAYAVQQAQHGVDAPSGAADQTGDEPTAKSVMVEQNEAAARGLPPQAATIADVPVEAFDSMDGEKAVLGNGQEVTLGENVADAAATEQDPQSEPKEGDEIVDAEVVDDEPNEELTPLEQRDANIAAALAEHAKERAGIEGTVDITDVSLDEASGEATVSYTLDGTAYMAIVNVDIENNVTVDQVTTAA